VSLLVNEEKPGARENGKMILTQKSRESKKTEFETARLYCTGQWT